MQAIDSKDEVSLSPVPTHLLEAVREKNCVLYAGAGFSLEAKMRDGAKLPTGSGLGFRLAQELYREGYLSQEPKEDQFFNFESLAEDYETAFGRHNLTLLLHEVFGAHGLMPGEAHELAIKLFPTIITTNFEPLLEHAAIRLGYQPIVITRDKQIPFAGALNRPTIIKLHGDLNDPETIVVTTQDYRRHPIPESLREKLLSMLSEKTVLFIGCGLVDSDLQEVYYESLDRLGNLKPRSYLVTPFPAEDSPERKQWELFRKRWESRGMQLINGKAGEFLKAIDEQLLRSQAKDSRGDWAEEANEKDNSERLVADYRAHLTEQVKWVRLFGLEGRQKLEKVFVDLTIIEDYRRPHLHAEFLGMMDADMRRQRSLFSDEDQKEPGREKEKRTVRPDELLSRRTRAVITGAPGCGKTTLLRYLAFQTLKENKRLPVFLELKTIGRDDFEKTHNLADLLFEKALVGQSHLDGAQRERLKEYFLARLDAGEAAVFLDGLDELSEEAFADLCNKVNEFVRSTHRDNLLIISTRPYALKSQFDGLEQMEIAPLDQRQIEQFIDHYYGDDEITERLLHELRRRREMGELARTPMLLGAMIALYRDRGKIIEDRLELYRQIVLHLAVRLDDEKGIRRVRQFHLLDPDGSLKLDFLKELACERLLIDEVKADGETGEAARVVFTGEQIVDKAKLFLERTNRLEISPYLLAADVKATPLLREVGADVYAFSHLTIQEYLAASALARRKDCREIFCRAYFNTTIVEMEVLPMTLGLMSNAAELYTTLEQLPESLNFASLRLRARGLGYGANAGREHLTSLTERLLEFIAGCAAEEEPYSWVIVRAFSHAARRPSDFIIPRVASLLKDEDSNVRGSAAYALGLIRSDRAVDALLSALNDEDSYVRWSAAYALGLIRSDRAVDALLSALNHQDSDVRGNAASALGRIGSERAVDALLSALNDQDSGVRRSAASALGQIGSERAVDALLSALNDQDSFVRGSAASALGQIGSERAIDTLLSALNDQDSGVRRSAASALGQIGSERAIDALLSALNHQDSTVRGRAASALGRIGSERAVDALLSALNDQHSTVRGRAASALGRIGSERAVDALLSALNDQDSGVRRSAASALGQIGSERAIDALLSALNHQDSTVRGRAASALGQIGSERAVDALLSALNDQNSYVRRSAAYALGKIKDDALKGGLYLALSGERVFARIKAVKTLSYYIDSRELLDQLSRIAATDPVEEVRQAASEAIEKFIRKLQLLGEEANALAAAEEIGREKTLEETRAFIAHEVKNAIVPLKGFTTLLDKALSQTDPDREALDKYIRQILKQTDIAFEVVNQYVDYSRPMIPSTKPTDIDQLLSDCIVEVRPRCETVGIDISLHTQEAIIISIDPLLISQVLRNVLLNAVEAVERDGRIRVDARRGEDRVIISVSDTGPGVRPEHLGRIFDLGFTTKMGRHGAGIGLALARRIVEEGHRGKIRMANNTDGPGATVTIELPAS